SPRHGTRREPHSFPTRRSSDLVRLREDPEQPFYRFEDHDGRPALRYASARRMAEACVRCHNNHQDSTKKDWKEGDVPGVLEIIRSEEHTSELQSLAYLVCRLLL